MIKSRKLVWVIASVIALGAALVFPASAVEKDAKVGVLDTQKLFNDAPRIKQYKEELDTARQSLISKLDIRSKNLLLNEAEIKELIDIKTKITATDKDKARIKELEDVQSARDAEKNQLAQTNPLSEVQKARMKELQDMQQNAKTTGESLEKDYNSQLQNKAQELDDKVKADINEAIKKVAETSNYYLVLDKSAALYGGIDITDAVISKLDRKM